MKYNINYKERLLRLIHKTDDCWIWKGTVSQQHGYGHYGHTGIQAHRAVYEAFVGKISEGLQLDHLCRNKVCVNPAHLEPVTARENTLRSNAPSAINAKKTHCDSGHEFTEANTYRWAKRPRSRLCRECITIRSRNNYKLNLTKEI